MSSRHQDKRNPRDAIEMALQTRRPTVGNETLYLRDISTTLTTLPVVVTWTMTEWASWGGTGCPKSRRARESLCLSARGVGQEEQVGAL